MKSLPLRGDGLGKFDSTRGVALDCKKLVGAEVPEGHGHELGVGCAERADAGLLRCDARRQGCLGSRHADGDLGRGAVGSHEEGHAADRRFRSNGTTPVLQYSIY